MAQLRGRDEKSVVVITIITCSTANKKKTENKIKTRTTVEPYLTL